MPHRARASAQNLGNGGFRARPRVVTIPSLIGVLVFIYTSVNLVLLPLLLSSEKNNNLPASDIRRYMHNVRNERTRDVDQVVDLRHRNNSNNDSGISPAERSINRIDQLHRNNSSNSNNDSGFVDSVDFDFAIIGFPKTGTSMLQNILERHPEVVMPPGEFCHLHKADGDKIMVDWIRNQTAARESRNKGNASLPRSTPRPKLKFGIKCPGTISRTQSIVNIAKVSNETRIVVGVRHPIWWFESFYNYRVLEHHNEKLTEKIPTPFYLPKGGKHWHVIDLLSRFEVYLQQLGKVPLTPAELNSMTNGDRSQWPIEVVPNRFKVFIYTDEQPMDGDSTRRARFQDDLRKFLRLEGAMTDTGKMPKVNANTDWHEEYIEICHDRYSGIRRRLVEQAEKSRRWICDKFIRSDDVVVSGRDFFLSSLSSWSKDPCVTKLRRPIIMV